MTCENEAKAIGWIKTEDRMPGEAEELKPLALVVEGEYGLPYVGTGVWHNGSWSTSDPGVEFEPVLYWLELPEIPKDAWRGTD